MLDPQPLIPEVTEEDINWVRATMGLGTLDAPRLAFLTNRTTIDVSACPGSGKTTLIVAKLAIMARKWPHRTKGICVLSHTNVAREEIQQRLGCTFVGQRLLGYPHFIDTIHGFVNRFLALPWLSSNGFPSPTVDNSVTTAYRRRVLPPKDYQRLQSFLERKYSDFDQLRISTRDLKFQLGRKPFPASPAAPSFQLAKQAIEVAARAGYFCYDEMFVWARALLEDAPEVASWLRRRFPLVIIDEMQDTFALQSAMLHAVFPRTSADSVVQRVGDPNQAIFDGSDHDVAQDDPFPDPDTGRCLSIPNSYRFGPQIAALASPFALTAVSAEGLCGIGPRAIANVSGECPNAIFVFPDDCTKGVLDAYGKHALTTFDDSALAEGLVTAVGAVHQDASNVASGDAHFPKTVPHYWSEYSAELSRKEPHPQSFVQYLWAAKAVILDGRDLSPGVEKIASGLVRVAELIGDAKGLKRKARSHRSVLEALATDAEATTAYQHLLKTFLIDLLPLSAKTWSAMQREILTVASALCEGATKPISAERFLAWEIADPSRAAAAAASPKDAAPNIYRVEDGDRYVDIRLGSIHSVKGQTHLATMVLSTYWHKHSSERMLPWLLGARANEIGANSQDRTRLLQTYVAMTRPSHLICLAVRRSAFGDDKSFTRHRGTLITRGWRVVEIVDGIAQWYA